ncbi:HAD family hydrolase [Paenibacillus prosopidis]|uniref:Putative hydrolase of the HAD superfamily n=1 Tax=Paenibacillus prosopidis TaxID=630520 RepID=A0A368WA08_9BACL|nr:HAD-IA family hydrolase [Paenibacillus prosopidis]RCW50366.1 putative hydrolase of the HAD superfamily [Paenibacillus prosopidis]
MKRKAVIFDLFETLITEYSNGSRTSKRSYNYMELLGLSNEDFKQEWGSRQSRRMSGELADYPSVIKDIMLSRNLPFNKEAVMHLYKERKKEKTIPFENIRLDILELLSTLHEKNIKIGLISNCTEEEVQYWKKSIISHFFDDVIFSYEVGMAKPDKQIYLLSCKHLSSAPENTIFVGDGGSGELEGADKAGLRVYHATWFNTYIQSDFTKLKSPSDLLNKLE